MVISGGGGAWSAKEKTEVVAKVKAILQPAFVERAEGDPIRKIFGLGEKEKAKASRLLTSAVDGGYIKVMNPDTAPRYKKYIPYWA